MNFGTNQILIAVFSMVFLLPRMAGAGTGTFQEADSLLERGMYLEAASAYIELYRTGESDRDRALEMAGDIFSIYLNDKDRASDYYEKVLSDFPHSEYCDDALYNLAMISLGEGRIDQGRSCLEELVARYPDSPRHSTARFFLTRIRRNTDVSFAREAKFKFEERPIRVLLDRRRGAVELKFEDAFRIIDCSSGAFLAGRSAGARFSFSVARGGSLILMDRDLGTQCVDVEQAGNGSFSYEGRRYRGDLRLIASKGIIKVINIVPVEEYICGVVPGEMPSSWPADALRAQAIVARTYAIYQMDKRKGKEFDLYSTTASQVYKGASGENSRVTSAVNSTRGLIVFYDGKPALTYFHSNSGGEIEDDKYVWSTDLPYLAQRNDPYSAKSPTASWNISVDERKVSMAVDAGRALKECSVVRRSPSGRVELLELRFGSQRERVKGSKLRKALGPGVIKSTLFDVSFENGKLIFAGRGFGHGVGLSQWGAREMAAEGFDFRRIISFYYPGTEIRKVY